MDARLEAWAASGAMALTGRPDGDPLGPAERLVPMVVAAGDALRAGTRSNGIEVAVDPMALLGERAALAGLARRGPISCGGGTRLLPTADGTIAVALVRPDDLTAIPAWLRIDDVLDNATDDVVGGHDEDERRWATVAGVVRSRSTAELVEQAGLLGLAVAARPGPAPVPADAGGSGIRIEDHGPALGTRALPDVTVVDLSALWAGPLCGQLLAAGGARVAKVESTSRPDSSRWGDPGLFDLLNRSKASVALDLTLPEGRRTLHDLLRAADVVIESSRPRALEQLGIIAAELLADPAGPTTWISITGYGRIGPDANRIAYGDVAAVAGGLLADDAEGPCFCADAVADPLTGLTAAASAVDAVSSGRRLLVDVAMVGVSAAAAGRQLAVPGTPPTAIAPLCARTWVGAAPSLGADTGAVLDSWGLGR